MKWITSLTARKSVLTVTALVLAAGLTAAVVAQSPGASADPASCRPGGHFQCPASSPPPTSPSPSPSPSPTGTSPSPSPSPSPTGTLTPICVVTQPTGTPCALPAFTDPSSPLGYISNGNGFNTYAGNNCWADPSCTFTTTVFGPGLWDTQAQEPAGNTSVLAYPTVQQLYDSPPLSSLAGLSSGYAETMNATAGTIAWAAYDVWLDNWGAEVLIAVDNHGIDPSYLPQAGTFTVSGVAYTAYRNGSERVVVADVNAPSGTADILGVLTALTSLGQLPGGDTLTAVDFGWEICSTGGADEDFAASSYWLSVM